MRFCELFHFEHFEHVSSVELKTCFLESTFRWSLLEKLCFFKISFYNFLSLINNSKTLAHCFQSFDLIKESPTIFIFILFQNNTNSKFHSVNLVAPSKVITWHQQENISLITKQILMLLRLLTSSVIEWKHSSIYFVLQLYRLFSNVNYTFCDSVIYFWRLLVAIFWYLSGVLVSPMWKKKENFHRIKKCTEICSIDFEEDFLLGNWS